jgi:hypothetical protein
LLPFCAVVGTVVGAPGGTVGEPVVWVVGATVGVTGTTAGVEGTAPGVVGTTVAVPEGVVPGVLLGSFDPTGVGDDSIV